VRRRTRDRGLIWVLSGITLVLVVPPLCGVRVTHLTRDPVQLAHLPFYTGVLSNVGCLLWCATAVVCLFSAHVVLRCGGHETAAHFLAWSSVLTLLLLADDLLLIHEATSKYANAHTDYLYYAAYASLFSILVFRYRRLIFLQTRCRLLLWAAVPLALSLVMDLDWLPGGTDVEDGLKVYGIGLYFYFYVVTARDVVMETFDVAGAGSH